MDERARADMGVGISEGGGRREGEAYLSADNAGLAMVVLLRDAGCLIVVGVSNFGVVGCRERRLCGLTRSSCSVSDVLAMKR